MEKGSYHSINLGTENPLEKHKIVFRHQGGQSRVSYGSL